MLCDRVHRVAERVGERGSRVWRDFELAVLDVERTASVKRPRVAFGWFVALAFNGSNVHQNRAGHGPRGDQRIHEHVDVVAVERSHVAEPGPPRNHGRLTRRRDEAHRCNLGAGERLARGPAERQVPEDVVGAVAGDVRKRFAPQYRKIRCHGPDVGRDGHLVVVEDDDEIRVGVCPRC